MPPLGRRRGAGLAGIPGSPESVGGVSCSACQLARRESPGPARRGYPDAYRYHDARAKCALGQPEASAPGPEPQPCASRSPRAPAGATPASVASNGSIAWVAADAHSSITPSDRAAATRPSRSRSCDSNRFGGVLVVAADDRSAAAASLARRSRPSVSSRWQSARVSRMKRRNLSPTSAARAGRRARALRRPSHLAASRAPPRSQARGSGR